VAQPTFRILGRLEILVEDRPVDLPSRRERALLGVLLLYAGQVVSTDRLIDSVWGESVPVSARHMVQEYISRLRADLGDGAVIATRSPGYALEPEPDALDADRFSALVAAARASVAADELEAGLEAYDEALQLWRGEVLAGIPLEGEAHAAATRLEAQRRAAWLERVEVALALGRHNELVPELERAVASEPLDEQLLRKLMIALYRSGRQADALARYRDGRQRLVDELGIEPTAESRSLEQAILRHDPDLTVTAARPARTDAGQRSSYQRRRLRWAMAVGGIAGGISVALAAGLVIADRRAGAAPVDGNAIAVVDATRARLLASIPVDVRPGAIAAGAGSLWVASPDTSSLTRVSPVTRRVVATVPLERPAASLAAAGGGIWAVGSIDTDTSLMLQRIDPTFNTSVRVRRLPMVVIGDTGSLADAGSTLVVAPRSGFLTRIGTRTGRALSRIDPNAAPTAVAQGFGSSWLAYREADAVLRIDASGSTTTIPVGREPSAVTVGRHAVWVANSLDGTVKSIDPATSSVITTVKVGRAPSALAEGDGDIWVANAGDGTLTRINERTNEPTAHVRVGGSPQGLAVVAGKVWVSIQSQPAAQPAGGTLVVSVPSFNVHFDPAVEDTYDSAPIEYAICSTLLNFPDASGPAGMRLVPDAARSMPTVSKDGRTYTFLIRRGIRFSPPSNQLVTAETFKDAIERSLSPRKSMGLEGSGLGQYDLGGRLVGAAAYTAGRTPHIAGVTARGYRLTIRLTHRNPDLPELISDIPFCAVPTDTPLKPQDGAFPTSGPYYIAAETPGRSLTLLRNPNYHGDRPQRPHKIEVVIGQQHPVAAVEAGKIDYAIDGVTPDQSVHLARQYGPGSPAAHRGHQQYFVNPRLEIDTIDLNTSRPLFASKNMRRAVNYAVDRRALAANGGPSSHTRPSHRCTSLLASPASATNASTPSRPTSRRPAASPAPATTRRCSTASSRQAPAASAPPRSSPTTWKRSASTSKSTACPATSSTTAS
jgi:YVTN family beta-propeller protein